MILETQYYKSMLALVKSTDPIVAKAIVDELKAQRSRLKLIASENFSSIPVQASMGELLTDKYSEGFVKHRYYSGCEQVDTVEQEANELACKLFGAEHAYCQPHCGADANFDAYWAVLKAKGIDIKTSRPKLLSLSLESGGHLTHSSDQNVVTQIFDIETYSAKDDGFLDYDEIEKKALEVKPTILLAGFSAYPRNLNFRKFRDIADKCGAVLMVDMAHFAGLVAGKVLTGDYDPIPFADIVTTTTHKTLRGPRGGLILCKEWLSSFVDRTCPTNQGGPLPHVMAAKALCFREAMTTEFQEYAKQIVANSKTLAKVLTENGIELQTGGTDNHLMLINLRNLGLNGRQAENALLDCGIVVNRNSIPNDPNGPWYTCGLRIGPAALTSLGMKEQQMEEIANLISTVLKNTKPSGKAKYILNDEIKNDVVGRVGKLLSEFELYPEIDINELESVL